MATATHTPGPWEAIIEEANADGDKLWSIQVAGYVSEDDPDADDKNIVAGIWGQDPVDEANARLISAAPELLAALKDVVAIADRITDEFDRARAAIAKAIGEA